MAAKVFFRFSVNNIRQLYTATFTGVRGTPEKSIAIVRTVQQNFRRNAQTKANWRTLEATKTPSGFSGN